MDWDKLFENALNVRWLIIDECSTLSPYLLSTLESFLRNKACVRHPYCYRNLKRRQDPRPFGGINIIFSGDLWQLPPVQELAIFANPTRKADGEPHDAGDQRIFSMFWDSGRHKDAIQELHELNVCKRNDGDDWLQEVLQANRYGRESWEMYCFQHGLPTRNPGSWLPSSGITCGNQSCQHLREQWDMLWRRDAMAWSERKQMECGRCKDERARRCRIITQRDENSHLHGIFVEAPFVHPFRAPTNHAQRLRALHFARSHRSRVLWVLAHDDVVVAKDGKKSATSAAKSSWLTYDDRKTAGVPGMFPLILDLPVRFTQEPDTNDRLKGVFTNARGILRGWDLPEQEAARLRDEDGAELVLYWRPTYLYIEMRSQNEALDLIDGKRIYRLRCHCKPWHLDANKQVEVRRFGFPIVPDFGGTAHAYCGTSLDACVGDLLDWWLKPYKDAAVRGYIIKSRVRRAENLLLAKPYSPWLFRLGAPAGPNYLLQTLRGKPRSEALKEWQQEEKEAEEKKQAEESHGLQTKWPFTMKLECRHCERLLRLTAFTTYRSYDDLWAMCISRGADLACMRCKDELGLEHMPTAVIFCEGCQQMKRKKDFSLAMQSNWSFMRQDVPIQCKRCESNKKGRQPVDERLFVCCGAECSAGKDPLRWSELHFQEPELVDAVARRRTPKCARCQVSANRTLDDIGFACDGCGERKQLKDFTAVVCKQYLLGERRAAKKCFECHFPECAIDGCRERPKVAVSHNHVEKDGKWYCHSHRYPPCCVCKTAIRPASSISSKVKFKEWICSDCKQKQAGQEDTSAAKEKEISGDVQADDANAKLSELVAGNAGNEPQASAGEGALKCYFCGRQGEKNEEHFVKIDKGWTKNGKARCTTCTFRPCGSCKKPPTQRLYRLMTLKSIGRQGNGTILIRPQTTDTSRAQAQTLGPRTLTDGQTDRQTGRQTD